MNPALNSTLQRHVNTSASPLVPTSAPQSPQNDTSRELSETPSLAENSQGLDLKQMKERESFKLDLDRINKILGKLTESSALTEMRTLEKNDLEYIVQALFFSQDNNHKGCFLNQIYKDPSLSELLPVFEEAIDKLIFNITIHSISNGLPSKPEGEINLNAILDILREHLQTVKDPQERPTKISAYLQLYFLLSAYYEAPALDGAFTEYAKTRIAKLEKLIGCLGPLSLEECCLALAKINKAGIHLQITLFKFSKDSPSHLLKVKQDFACWLMTSFNVDKDERSYQLLILDFLNDVFQKCNIKTAFHKQGIDLDKEPLSDPMFVSCMLQADSEFLQNTEAFRQHKGTLTHCEPEKARVHLLQKLERLGLQPEIINKHHSILELALELKDAELLRHLVLEYKFNPYYISDTTGYSLYHIAYNDILPEKKHNFSFDFQVECKAIVRRCDRTYYKIDPQLSIVDEMVENVSLGATELKFFNINLQNQWGETPLIRAAKFGLDAKHLFIKELDITLQDHTGKTALDYAKENNNKPLASLIEERKRAITTVKLIETLGVSGKKDNYQRFIAFLHKKGNDGLSLIEKAYQTQNTLIIEAVESYLPFILINLEQYIRTPEGKKIQPLKPEHVLKYLKACFAKNQPEAFNSLELYAYYYYCMNTYTELADTVLNEAIHGLIALITDVRELDTLSQDMIGSLINLFAKLSKEAQTPKQEEDRHPLENIARQAYRNVAHFLLSPVRIKNQSHSSFIVSFLSRSSIRAIHSQKEVIETKLDLQRDFLNSLPFFSNILEFSKQNFLGYRSDIVAIVEKLQDLGLNRDVFNADPVFFFDLVVKFGDFSLLKHLTLKAGFNPFSSYNESGYNWSCAAYCRDLKLLSQKTADPKVREDFHNGWKNEIEPVLLKQYLDLPPHSPKNPRIDLIAQGEIEATPETINLQNKWGETPLIFATKYAYDVERLLKISGIDIQKKDKYKKTALNYATENEDPHSQRAIGDYFKKGNQSQQLPTPKKLSKRQVAESKAGQKRLKKETLKKQQQAQASAIKNSNTPPSKGSPKPSPAPITINAPGVEKPTDNFVHQEPVKELSHLKKAKEQVDKEGKKQEAKKKKSLLGRVVSGAKELKSTLATAVNIVKNPSDAGNKILKQAVKRLATSKEVSTRLKTQDKPLLSYPDLLELLDLVQAGDSQLHIGNNIQRILAELDGALKAHYKNPNIKFNLDDIETVLKQFYPDMTVSQHGSHRTYHFTGMKAITVATHEKNTIHKQALQAVTSKVREALLNKLGIKNLDTSEQEQNPSPTDSPPVESKGEESEGEKSDEFSS